MNAFAYLLRFALLSALPLALSAQAGSASGDAAEGERLYQAQCAGCHGPRGEGGRGPTLAVPRLSKASTEDELVAVIMNGIWGTDMPAAALEYEQIKKVAAWVRELGRMRPETVAGDPGRGEKLYFTKGACAQCHAIKGRGSAFGPDLTEIGLRRGAAYLRTALTDPDADVPKSFLPYRTDVSIPDNFLRVRLITRDGRHVAGVRINEDTFSIQVRDISGGAHSYFKSELLELHKDWGKSPMPAYGEVFSREELDDVVAFLASLRGVQ